MFYELRVTLNTIRKEGLGSFIRKFFLYFKQLAGGFLFRFKKQPTGNNSTESLAFAKSTCGGLIQPMQVDQEIINLLDLVREKKPRTVVEIGTANGGSLFLFCQVVADNAQIVSIDLPNGIHGGGYPYWRAGVYQRFTHSSQKLVLLRADSHAPETLRELNTLLGNQLIDFLFIDGDHTYEGVKKDFELHSPRVRPGGIIAFHDIAKHFEHYNCHVDEFWNEVKQRYEHQEFIHDRTQGSCGIGVLFVGEKPSAPTPR
jgi:predicted O-methyltransferase YrrM